MEGNVLYFIAGSGRSAMTDLFKNLINNLDKPEKIIAVASKGYDRAEFPDKLLYLDYDQITGVGKKKTFLESVCQYFLSWKYAYHIRKIIHNYNIQKVFFLNSHFVYQFPIVILNPHCKYTLWLHDPVLHEGVSSRSKIFRYLAERLVFPRIQKFIVSYQAAIQLMEQRAALRSCIARTCVIPLPQMKTMEFADIHDDETLPVRWTFIFYGRIEEYKGLNLLLDAMKDPEMQHIRLLIVGRGSDDQQIRKIVNSLVNVKFINDYVPDKELAKYIKQSRFVILPYKSATGSQTITIANYYEKMVLATKVGCFPEYIQEGKNGFFIDSYTKEDIKKAMLKMACIDESTYKERIKNEYDKYDIKCIAEKVYRVVSDA